MTKRLNAVLAPASGLGLLAALLLWSPMAWRSAVVSWWSAVAPRWPVLLLAVVSLAGLVASVVLHRRGSRVHEASAAPSPPDRPLRPLPWWIVPAGVVLAAAVTGAAVWWLHSHVPAGGDVLERAKLRVEGIRTGLTIGAAVTGGL